MMTHSQSEGIHLLGGLDELRPQRSESADKLEELLSGSQSIVRNAAFRGSIAELLNKNSRQTVN
jgi:hypothetical protein